MGKSCDSETELTSLETWLKDEALNGRISKVKVSLPSHAQYLTDMPQQFPWLLQASTRLTSSPAVVTDHESASMRKMMRMLDIVSHQQFNPPPATC